MAKKSKLPKQIEQYQHADKERVNNPHIGMVNEATEKYEKAEKKTYEYDPHLDPQLQWTGKAERTSFEVPTVSLHVHERIDPKTIIEAVKKDKEEGDQMSLFEQEKKPLREAIEFYKHKEGWTNRLIAGDSLLVMNSLLEKEGMGGKVQMVYLDPPYGIKYGSNFQPFVSKKDVKDGKDEDLTQEPEMIKAFRDTWELGVHSYLSYMKDRIRLCYDLLADSGSIFIQISDENIHHIREILDEVFGPQNFVRMIAYKTTSGLGQQYLDKCGDYLVWYAKDATQSKYRELFVEKVIDEALKKTYSSITIDKKSFETISSWENRNDEVLSERNLPQGSKLVKFGDLKSQSGDGGEIIIDGKRYFTKFGSWKTNQNGIDNLWKNGRIKIGGSVPAYIRYHDDFPATKLTNIWYDTGTGGDYKKYVVQTNTRIIERCILMTSDPGDLILDITCGSGTTAYVAENWGRRWITCDTSRIAITLSKQRLMTSSFPYYKLARPDEGIAGAFEYKTIPHVTLKSIANNEPPPQEVLYDLPKIDSRKTRVTGPYTIESIPAPFVKNLDEVMDKQGTVDNSVAKSGETIRQDEWRDELLRAGVRAKGGAIIEFSRIEAQQGTKYIQALAETKEDNPKNVLVVFGPEHAPMDARLVELALDEAKYSWIFKPRI